MARVSLIVLQPSVLEWPSARVAAYRAGLEDRGFSVEVLAVFDPASQASLSVDEPWCHSIVADRSDQVAMANQGIRSAKGQFLVVVDLAIAYTFDAILAIVETLASGRAELVIASRPTGLLGRIARGIVGTSDPTSGLAGLTRTSILEPASGSTAEGSRLVLEFLTSVRGRKLDVPVTQSLHSSRSSNLFDDLRQWKRLADERLGVVSRFVQFCAVGASGMVVDLTIYAALRSFFSRTVLAGTPAPLVGGTLDLAVSAILAIATALTWNFSINRRLTFNDARRVGSIFQQYVRYVLSNLLGIGVSLSIRLILPGRVAFFESNHQAAAVVGILAATGISFSMARWFVFSPRSQPPLDRSRNILVASRGTVSSDGFRHPRHENGAGAIGARRTASRSRN